MHVKEISSIQLRNNNIRSAKSQILKGVNLKLTIVSIEFAHKKKIDNPNECILNKSVFLLVSSGFNGK